MQDSVYRVIAEHLPIDPRRLTVLLALIIAIVETRTVCLYRLVPKIHLPGTEESVYKRLKRFVGWDWKEAGHLIARFVLSHFQEDEELLLILDRTNWKLGQQHINFLILSVVWKSFSFPLGWKLLPHAGNSHTQDRIQLVQAVLPLMQGKRLALLADREFVGTQWFMALKSLGIKPTIRLKVDCKGDGTPIWAYFKKMQPGELRIWHRAVEIYGVRMRILACKNLRGQTLYLAYHGWGEHAIKRYAWRWNVECLHQALKSRGFDLESTRLTTTTRLSTLFGIVSLAFVWCCLCGQFLEAIFPSKRLRHGYPQKSIFRRGLDAIQTALRNLAWRKKSPHPSFSQLLATFVP